MTEITTKLTTYSQQTKAYRADVEAAILGALILEHEAIPQVYQILAAKNFTGKNQIIFQTIQQMVQEKQPVDILTTVHACRPHQIKAWEVVNLTTKVNSAANIIQHAAILLELNITNAFIKLYTDHCDDKKVEAFAEDILQSLVTTSGQSINIIEDATYFINKLLPESAFAEALKDFYQSMQQRFKIISNRQSEKIYG